VFIVYCLLFIVYCLLFIVHFGFRAHTVALGAAEAHREGPRGQARELRDSLVWGLVGGVWDLGLVVCGSGSGFMVQGSWLTLNTQNLKP